jgi:hypothetical protein
MSDPFFPRDDAEFYKKRCDELEKQNETLKENAFLVKPFEELRLQNLVISLANAEARLAKAQGMLDSITKDAFGVWYGSMLLETMGWELFVKDRKTLGGDE